jgi:hypothetical protein
MEAVLHRLSSFKIRRSREFYYRTNVVNIPSVRGFFGKQGASRACRVKAHRRGVAGPYGEEAQHRPGVHGYRIRQLSQSGLVRIREPSPPMLAFPDPYLNETYSTPPGSGVRSRSRNTSGSSAIGSESWSPLGVRMRCGRRPRRFCCPFYRKTEDRPPPGVIPDRFSRPSRNPGACV